MPNFPGIFALKAGIDFLLSVGVERLDRELRPVVKALRDGLQEMGLDLLTPAPPEFASGIVSFQCDEPAEMAARMASRVWWCGEAMGVYVFPFTFTTTRTISTAVFKSSASSRDGAQGPKRGSSSRLRPQRRLVGMAVRRTGK